MCPLFGGSTSCSSMEEQHQICQELVAGGVVHEHPAARLGIESCTEKHKCETLPTYIYNYTHSIVVLDTDG